MAQVFNPQFIQNIQSNLEINIGYKTELTDNEQISPSKYKNYYFQLLIFEDLKEQPKLFYGTKKDLVEYFDIKDEEVFPTSGVEIKPGFVPSDKTDPLAKTIFDTTRFLLQTRKISQMITYTWLELDQHDDISEEMKEKIQLVRQILKFPSVPLDTYWLDSQKDPELLQRTIDLEEKLLELKKDPEKASYLDLLIKPGHTSYNTISLALLLCGQAYYKNKNGKYSRVWEPIGSIYQLIFELGVDLSWELFYGTIIELTNLGKAQIFPINKVTLPYPPRPSEFNLNQTQIKEWATAPADSEDNPYPFYPQEYCKEDPHKHTQEWEEHQLKYVTPPYPYIPLSSL